MITSVYHRKSDYSLCEGENLLKLGYNFEIDCLQLSFVDRGTFLCRLFDGSYSFNLHSVDFL